MKLTIKTFLIISLFFTFTNCEEIESTDSNEKLEDFYKKMQEATYSTMQMTRNNIEFSTNGSLNYESIRSGINENLLTELGQNQFVIQQYNLKQTSNGRVSEINPIDAINSASDVYSKIQIDFISQLYSDGESIKSIYELEAIVLKAKDEVLYSTNFSQEEQIELLSLIATIESFYHYSLSDDIKLFAQEVLSHDSNSNGRLSNDGSCVWYDFECVAERGNNSPYAIDAGGGGCHVDWRNVWGSAVVSFFGAGATGAYIGCTGGTVVLPVFGTITGCVGGAVFGATGGFVTGALYGVASELLTSCGR